MDIQLQGNPKTKAFIISPDDLKKTASLYVDENRLSITKADYENKCPTFQVIAALKTPDVAYDEDLNDEVRRHKFVPC
jgi:hypothetical protein